MSTRDVNTHTKYVIYSQQIDYRKHGVTHRKHVNGTRLYDETPSPDLINRPLKPARNGIELKTHQSTCVNHN